MKMPTSSDQNSKKINIVLGVTGSIAAYKAPDLVRRLRELGADVRVVLTDGAKAFITPLTLQAVSGYPVVYDLLDPAHEAGMGHIELARWADIVLIAPASANTIATLAHGFANDLLSAICLATESPILLAPGMNRLMWDNPATQSNIEMLRSRNITIMEPGSGSQACGEIGKGRMPEPMEIRDFIDLHYLQSSTDNKILLGKSVVITAGPTIEEIDPVRFISNYSSGKMGYSIAEAAVKAGANVTLISGPVALDPPKGLKVIEIKTAEELLSASLKATKEADLFIAAAAVADYRVIDQASEKIKKSDESDTMTLTLTKNPDILATIANLKENRPFCVGFAAETNDIIHHATDKLKRKNLDMICLNDVSGGKVFGEDQNELLIIDRDGNQTAIPKAFKSDIAREIIAIISRSLPL